MNRIRVCLVLVVALVPAALTIAAHPTASAGPVAALASGQGRGGRQDTPPDRTPFDPETVERGRQLLVAQCGFCHGSNARGGSSGPDLTRSPLVQDDENGKQIGEFLRVGRPD